MELEIEGAVIRRGAETGAKGRGRGTDPRAPAGRRCSRSRDLGRHENELSGGDRRLATADRDAGQRTMVGPSLGVCSRPRAL